jgi:hypothetical protein
LHRCSKVIRSDLNVLCFWRRRKVDMLNLD